eukprot:4133566-Lingulodinium_polyedra.AAC.1
MAAVRFGHGSPRSRVRPVVCPFRFAGPDVAIAPGPERGEGHATGRQPRIHVRPPGVVAEEF